VAIEYRSAEGHYDRLAGLVADLIRRPVDVILAAGGSDPAKAAKAATSKIPIIFVSAADPVRTGLVVSLNRPGGNVTGVSLLASTLDAKERVRRMLRQSSSVVATSREGHRLRRSNRRRNKQPDQNRNDGNDDQQPDERECLSHHTGSLSVVGSAGGYWHTNTKTVVLDLDGFGLGPAINGVEFFDGQFVTGPVVAVAHDRFSVVLVPFGGHITRSSAIRLLLGVCPFDGAVSERPTRDMIEFGLIQFMLACCSGVDCDVLAHRRLHPSLASIHRWCAATLAQRSLRHCEPVHRQHPNPTFRDGHHRRRSGVL
jgi:hypothetical protein